MSNHGYKPKQINIPMDLYRLIQKWGYEERDTNMTGVILRMLRRCVTELSPEPLAGLPEVAPPLFPDDESDRDQPEIIRLRKVFPNNELEVQRQLKEIEMGLKQAGETEDNIRLILYGPDNN